MRRKGYNLMTGSLDGSCFMHVYMTRFNSQDSFIASHYEVYDGGIGLCAPCKKHRVTISVVKSAGAKYIFFRTGSVAVVSVARSLFHVCVREPFEDLGMASAHIVTVEM